MNSVERLARVVGLDRRSPERFDWAWVESRLGVGLPGDFKLLVETFPDGYFQGVVRPFRPNLSDGQAGYPLDSAHEYRLEDMRGWREDEPERFPLPIFPEAGGLLPWGQSQRGDLFFWRTGDGDPGAWPVVFSDHEFSFWEDFGGTACDFLEQVVTGGIEIARFEGDADTGPRFDIPVPPGGDADPSPEAFWLEQRRFPGVPQLRDAELLAAVERAVHTPEVVDWAAVERKLGLPLPTDYKRFVDACGPGRFGDIAIAVPGTDRGLEFFRLIEEQAERAQRIESRQASSGPVHPQVGGLIAWGRTDDGWTCHWAPTDLNPDLWGVVNVPPSGNGWEYLVSESFSSMLLHYADPEPSSLFLTRDTPRPAEVTFRPV